ncbi:inovirus Gp2 family protein [Cronobacter sakazakii]|uniref:inovirus Gp2 family protein n=1 Tax=Cronobacter sakazakii TaxID=28141 RepID=UPI000CF0E99B|nr:inovirus Gp2 family protein [Cronobacter sakazakii]ELQ8331611.1 inovirus Gp2 family protein [Klebsiella oxytoca]ELY4780946.1 inovirus Gp2 family protein [Cronobacter sakazakii]KAB0815087.1 inovirus Gp2 family protein [Cronobacter sakazakii]PPY06492.1 inovirus Gp2 family protein [Cronobacter sakazakii]
MNKFDNIELDKRHAPFNEYYLERLLEIIDRAIDDHPRTMALRVDLHLPEYRDCGDSIACNPNLSSGLMSRFIGSLRAKIDALRKRTVKRLGSAPSCRLRYLWVREWGEKSGKWHYHAVLFVNKDMFAWMGKYNERPGRGQGLASLIQQAWLSALGWPEEEEYRSLIHIPKNPCYWLNTGAADFQDAYDDLTFRLSYLAKERTKSYSREERSFGCSER